MDTEIKPWIKWSEEEIENWKSWLNTMPEHIKEMVKKYDLDPQFLYQIKKTGQKGTLTGFTKEGNISINIAKRFNPEMLFPGRTIDGFKPEEIERCNFDKKV